MSDVREIPAVLEAAERAASSGDLPAAEALLHDVVRLQETSLGPRHADLASTLNNLAVVCEMAGKPEDAEQFYRRAYAIASASLATDDPLVATSLNNLREFCQARGIATDLPAEMRAEEVAVVTPETTPIAVPTTPAGRVVAETATAEPALTTKPFTPERVRTEPTPAERVVAVAPATLAEVRPEAAPSGSSRPTVSSGTVIGGVLVGAALVAALMVFWPRGQDGPDSAGEAAAPPAAIAPAPAAAAQPQSAIEPPSPPAPPIVEAPARPAPPRPSPSTRPNIRVLEAKVCRSLSTEGAEWRCVAPSNPAAPGRLSFYTRLAVSEDIRVRHRWYHGDRLVQDVGLNVRANPGAGYRTYSRQTVNAVGGGEWRVEVRTSDGAVLREERFVVR